MNTAAAAMAEFNIGDLVAQALEAAGVTAVYGVVSIHNMPILDAIGRRGVIRLVASRGEAGAVNMADAHARVTGTLGVAVTSTGTAAGNAAGAMVEALTAGSPLLHLTGQIESAHVDRNRAYIHEAPEQLKMLEAVSKSAWRIGSLADALPVLTQAIQHALTPPTGPVSVEIPIDLQAAQMRPPLSIALPRIERIQPQDADVQAVATALKNARRPMMLLGGGARGAEEAARQLADMGVGVVTSTSGRAIVAEDHPGSLGAFNVSHELQSLYRTCDCFLAVGTRLRSNETWTYKLALPEHRFIVNCDVAANDHAYVGGRFVHADSRLFLEALVNRLRGGLQVDPAFPADIAGVRAQSERKLREDIGVYSQLVTALQEEMPADAIWVRDVTISNSMWGNRLLHISAARNGVHAVGGGIGQGVAMAVGASIAVRDRKVVALCGDGGFTLNLGELITAAQENANVTVLLMNDRGYGVIKNIQDAQYGGRRYGAEILTPNFTHVARSLGIAHHMVTAPEQFRSALRAALAIDGPAIVEVDMLSVGPFRRAFAGPPVKS
ncbi:MAG: thiamine pyrophosphate-binding protein [Steroidobacteraceae bacterium]